MYNCGRCNFRLDEGALFCGNCGQEVVFPPGSTPAASTDARAATPSSLSYSEPGSLKTHIPSYPTLGPKDVPQQSGLPPITPVQNQGTNDDIRPLIAMILGILSLLTSRLLIGFLPGVVAIILGATSLKSRNKGMAITGIVLGAITVVFVVRFMLGFREEMNKF